MSSPLWHMPPERSACLMIILFHFSGVEIVFSKNTRHFHVAGSRRTGPSRICPLPNWGRHPSIVTPLSLGVHGDNTCSTFQVYSSLRLCVQLFLSRSILSLPRALSSTWPFSYIAFCSCPDFQISKSVAGVVAAISDEHLEYRCELICPHSLSLFSVHPPPATIQQLPVVTQLCLSAPSYPGHRVH